MTPAFPLTLKIPYPILYDQDTNRRGGDKVKTNQATAEVFFTAFKALRSNEKKAFLEKIIADSKLRNDLIDIALIEKAKKSKGSPVSAREYFTSRRKSVAFCGT